MQQGLAWLFYKHMHVCVRVCVMRSCFPMCGINLITCLVRPQGNGGNSPHHPHPHSNRRCCPFPSPARWPLQWPAPGPPERERKRERQIDRERETGYTPAAFKAAVMHECVRQLHLCVHEKKPDRRFTSNRTARELTKHTHRVNLPDAYDFSLLCCTLHFSLSARG